MERDIRPWGSYEVLAEGDGYKVKRIVVKPHERLSLQYHNHREENWIIVRGSGIVTIGKKAIPCKRGKKFFIPIGAPHRIENNGDVTLEFIEVQVGDYLGEDDIVRIQDDYGRAQSPSPE